jgi:hypothetical protein
MAVLAPDFVPSAEAYRCRLRHAASPRCNGLIGCALAMAGTQLLMTTAVSEYVNLEIAVQVEFALSGYLFASFLLRDRRKTRLPAPETWASRAGGFLQTLPTLYLFTIVVTAVYLPQLMAMDKVPVPDMAEVPDLIVRGLRSGLDEFLKGKADGRSLIALPLMILFVPMRWQSVTFLAFLGCGLTVQFSELAGGGARPASMLVAPSPLDLLAVGVLVATVGQGFGRSGNAILARWGLVMGLALVTATVGARSQNGLANWGTMGLLSAPAGFGAVNFILKIMSTTLVASLAWRDIGR